MKSLRRSNLVHALPILLMAFPAFAQSPLEVNEAEAQQHLVKHVDPVYPTVAKAANAEGDVLLQIEIGQDGHVASLKPLSGPPTPDELKYLRRLDHDGVDIGSCEKASTVHYFS